MLSRSPGDKGSKKQVQAENANALRKSSDSETDRLQDIQEEPRRHIGPSHVKELAKFFTPTAESTTGQDARSSLSQRRRRSVRNKQCNLTLKHKLGPLRTVLCFPERSS